MSNVNDYWVIQPNERAWYEQQFNTLGPKNGVITGEDAKVFLLRSQLPPQLLAQIWTLSDRDADGKMNLDEFSISCKLIFMKLRGTEIPNTLPQSLIASLKTCVTSGSNTPVAKSLINMNVAPVRPQQPPPQQQQQPLIQTAIVQPLPIAQPQPLISSLIGMQPAVQPLIQPGVQPLVQPGFQPSVQPGVQPLIQPSVAPLVQTDVPTAPHMSPVAAVTPPVVFVSNTPRASIEKALSAESPQVEWSVPHQTKLKYTQLFNTTDRARSGFLSGAQARNVMIQSKLPQNILAKIWFLSDMDKDGQLGCEEFVLAMHLCEQAASGTMPPTVLPPELIPPTFRRPGTRHGSVSSQGSVTHTEQSDHPTLHQQTSFEDKRKENFEKGQAELDRRRKTLLDAQRKEAEERERKEREENDRKERARQEVERKRLLELEAQMREQQEQERLKEEERKRQAEQREAARKEMERQRQLEWENQRSQELQQQRQREQEKVLKLKAKNQSLTIELTSLNDQVKELSQKICDTRVGVSNIKTTIDGMRTTRDTQMQEMSQLKNKLKEQNARLLALSHEKTKLEAKKQQINAQNQNEQTKTVAFENKEIIIKQLKDKVEDMHSQVEGKMMDIENNKKHLSELKTQLNSLVNDCENLYNVYDEKRNKVLELKGPKTQIDSWPKTNATEDWPVDDWPVEPQPISNTNNVTKYRALYEFVGRNADEISFQPGDIILVSFEQKGEPGWLAGEIRGRTGWFPQSYVEPVDGGDSGLSVNVAAAGVEEAEVEMKRLEGIAEVPETLSDTSSVDPTLNQQPFDTVSATEVEYYVASYPYQSVEQGDLSFNAGDVITVVKKEGDWWTGKIGEIIGIFPSNYVQKMEMNGTTAANTNNNTEQNVTTMLTQQQQQQELQELQQQDTIPPSGTDNEVSEIIENKMLDKSPDFSAMAASAQTLRSGKKPEIASVIAPYQATSPEQLSLQRGQLIMIRKKTDSGWWEGELQAKGKRRQVGWFPASYVKVLNSSGRASGRTTPVSASRMQQEVVIDKVIALFPYTANNPDELSFLKDDIISVTARIEPNWWRGELNGVSGLFPSNYVGPLQSFNSQEKVRQDCINELIVTEKAYLEDMNIVHSVFEGPLRLSEVITQEEVDGIFVNWREIIQCNEKFLDDLLLRQESGSVVFGDIISNHLPHMTGYVTFCSNQLDSAALLQRLIETSAPFRDVVRKCQSHPVTKGMPLSSFLIKPMQRITKYPLLIGKILENTPPTHPDYNYLNDALKRADQFCKQLNEGVRDKENYERLEWLQVHVNCDELKITFNSCTNCLGRRKLLHFGVLQKLKSGKELIGFLLNDFLLLVLPSKSLGSKQFTFQTHQNLSFRIYKQPIFIQELQASQGNTEQMENGTDMNRLLKIQDNCNNTQLSLLVSSANECNLWLKRIADAKHFYNKTNKTRHKNKNIIAGNACGRLLVVVQKGKRIIKSGKMYSDNIFCKVSVGDQEQVTDVIRNQIQNGNAPSVAPNGITSNSYLYWNANMQFHVRNIYEDNLIIVVYEKSLFTPDEFLGKAEVKIKDIVQQTQNTNGPVLKRLILHQVESGEVELKLDLHLFEN